MYIALPTRNNQIDDHFGHCEYFTIVEIENGKIIKEKKFDSPEGCGCKSGVAPLLAKEGVTVMLAGNMGMGAQQVLSSNGIKVIRGCSGPIQNVLNDFINGKLIDNQKVCDHHECH